MEADHQQYRTARAHWALLIPQRVKWNELDGQGVWSRFGELLGGMCCQEVATRQGVRLPFCITPRTMLSIRFQAHVLPHIAGVTKSVANAAGSQGTWDPAIPYATCSFTRLKSLQEISHDLDVKQPHLRCV